LYLLYRKLDGSYKNAEGIKSSDEVLISFTFYYCLRLRFEMTDVMLPITVE
jgi:hypothetical protein